MHFTIIVPHPFARLSRILAAVEKGRARDNPRSLDPLATLEQREADRVEGLRGLSTMSLTHCEGTGQPQGNDLSHFSLCSTEHAPSENHDNLTRMGLLQTHTDRPGH